MAKHPIGTTQCSVFFRKASPPHFRVGGKGLINCINTFARLHCCKVPLSTRRSCPYIGAKVSRLEAGRRNRKPSQTGGKETETDQEEKPA